MTSEATQLVDHDRVLDATLAGRSLHRPCLLLVVVTVLCLIPFYDKAYHIDDPLFVWAAQWIAKHPMDPYGFRLVWSTTELPMSEVNKNPPLASYYSAMIGSLVGWSEPALHLAFLLPAIAVVVGTFVLARRFTRSALLAALSALLTPGFIISASSVMCDTLMLAFWIFAAILWFKGIEPVKPWYLVGSGLLMAGGALTKYFGASLIPLLLLYSHARHRRFGVWAWFLLLPVVILVGYQFWTKTLYGRGLLLDAAAYAASWNNQGLYSVLEKGLVGLSFVGGCMLTGLTFAPLCWSRFRILGAIILSAVAGMAISLSWLNSGAPAPQEWRGLVSAQLALFVAGGVFVLALAAADLWRQRDADALFLSVWVFGTFYFAGYLNWTINARSVLPLIPAAGILLARRLDSLPSVFHKTGTVRLVLPLLVSGLVSLWLAWADTGLANSARTAAQVIHDKAGTQSGALWFQGHWGFQYYMEMLGARPVDEHRNELRAGDLVVIPGNNTSTFGLKPELIGSQETIQFELNQRLTTMNVRRGAGFYSSIWGPLPFAFGPAPPERYNLLRLAKRVDETNPGPQ